MTIRSISKDKHGRTHDLSTETGEIKLWSTDIRVRCYTLPRRSVVEIVMAIEHLNVEYFGEKLELTVPSVLSIVAAKSRVTTVSISGKYESSAGPPWDINRMCDVK
jgi:hypothetical protein